MGRPPKRPDEKYSGQVLVHMTLRERAKLEKEAKKTGLSLSALLMRPWRDQKGH
ncbi:MAG: hypothetical protein ABIH42_11440 [Planctomycetota bacterium]